MNRCKPRKDYNCMPMHECMPSCKPMPASGKRCIGTYSMKYRVYEDCDCEYDIRRICAYCDCEYDDQQDECPMCGAPADMGSNDDPPGNPDGFGGGRRFGGFGRFGGRGFGGFGFFPFFPFFLFRRFRRFRRF
ncbi:MAG: hypothetical protein K0R31_1300 [Clostridiales bacterium]|uniref:hypothetical protein n=1 Tax=Sporomusa sp. TaxID=2078658 RepID=UPI002977D1A9|nr:hypothetical protein [Sporomusa sp.]MDF2523659.1 hypothetical protein [Clostridiales bacterium]MDF2571653.1 hypothetical protein [Sporomusa sp.]